MSSERGGDEENASVDESDVSKPAAHSESFLGRWSSRKRETTTGNRSAQVAQTGAERTESAVEQRSVEQRPETDRQQGLDSLNTLGDDSPATVGVAVGEGAETPAGESGDAVSVDEPLLTDADMPPIETLDTESDLSGFFSKGVSATLRRAAFRHVFSQPAYNVRDGLNDYDGDFTVFEPLGDTVTADMKFHAARHERARLEREELARLEAEREEGIKQDRASEGEDDSLQGQSESEEADASDHEAPTETDRAQQAEAKEQARSGDGSEGGPVDGSVPRPIADSVEHANASGDATRMQVEQPLSAAANPVGSANPDQESQDV